MADTPPNMATADDPGAYDNRMSLNPNDPKYKSTLAEWEDNQTYTFERVTVRQISPGEFQVISATPGEPASPSEGQAATETEPPADEGAEEAGGGEGENPAMRKMMEMQRR